MNTPLISLDGVAYRYPHSSAGSRAALDGATLDVSAGEFIALVGANGSGKSTLARLLNGLLMPTEGEVLIDGMATADAANLDRIRETVGMVFQDPESQIVATTVQDDIAFGLENLGLPAPEIEQRVAAAAREFHLEEILGKEPHWLSGGQKQRTVLAGVMALKPRVLVLDEPTSMLDPRSQRQFMELVRTLGAAGVTIIHITHDIEEAAMAPRLVALSEGTVAFDGAPRDFFSRQELLRRTGLTPPLPARLSLAMREHGIDLPLALTLDELLESACAWS